MYLPHATKMHKLIPTCMQTLSSFDTRLQQWSNIASTRFQATRRSQPQNALQAMVSCACVRACVRACARDNGMLRVRTRGFSRDVRSRTRSISIWHQAGRSDNYLSRPPSSETPTTIITNGAFRAYTGSWCVVCPAVHRRIHNNLL